MFGWLLIGMGCSSNGTPTPSQDTVMPSQLETPVPGQTAQSGATPVVPGTATEPPPTDIPLPLAFEVNGEGITLEEFREAVARYELAQEVPPPLPEMAQIVMADLVDQLLLVQGAAQSGFIVDDAMLAERINRLVDALGSQQALADWQAANGFTNPIFEQELRRSIAAAWMRDQIIGAVPERAPQVRARQLLINNLEEAQQVLRQLQGGESFTTFLAIYDPFRLGEMGWFPRGYLLIAEMEDVAFTLQPGQYSDIVETSLGYHIIEVLATDPDRQLTQDARITLQERALADWLEAQRQQSEIVDYLSETKDELR